MCECAASVYTNETLVADSWCVCVSVNEFVCVCETEREGVCVRVCVRVYVCLYVLLCCINFTTELLVADSCWVCVCAYVRMHVCVCECL